MRGKLRDKHINKRNLFHNDDEEVTRRSARRTTHANQWIEQMDENEYDSYLDENESEDELALDNALDEEEHYVQEHIVDGRRFSAKQKRLRAY